MRRKIVGWFSVIVVLLLLLPVGSGAPRSGRQGAAPEEIEALARIQTRREKEILSRPGVLALGIGRKDGKLVFKVLVDRDLPTPLVPSQIEGVAVEVKGSEKIVAHNGGSACIPCHADQQSLPTPMGQSTSNANPCFAGTLGFIVCDSATSTRGYVTNNHVATAMSGSLCENGPAGSIQYERSSLDNGCSFTGIQPIGTLNKRILLGSGGNLVDAAFVTSGSNQTSTSIRDIGAPSASPGAVSLGNCVKKSGRTTGVTFAKVTMVNASVQVIGYCGGTFTFIQQIVYQADGTCGIGPISDPGDSGSPVLNTSNQIVALNFAGGGSGTSNIGIGNTVQNVLSQLGLTLGDCPPPPQPPPPGGCSAAAAMQGAPNSDTVLSLLHQLRGDVLALSPRGQAYANLFIQHSAEGVSILVRDPQLRSQTRDLIEHFVPAIQSLVDRGNTSVRTADIQWVDRWISAALPKCSPQLRGALQELQRDVHDSSALSEIGVRIER